MLRPRHRARLTSVLTHTLNKLIVPALRVGISLLVIDASSFDLWGAFVTLQVYVQLGLYLASWGSKDYLLREFSRAPSGLGLLFREALITRAWLLLPIAGVGAWWLREDPARLGWVAAWTALQFLFQSFEVLVTYRKRFVLGGAVEVVGAAAVAVGVLALGAGLSVDALIALSAAEAAIKVGALTLAFRGEVFGPLRRLGPDLGFLERAVPFLMLGFAGMIQARVDVLCISALMTDGDVGRYQVLFNFLMYLRNGAYFIVGPFVRNVYRLPLAASQRLARRLLAVGVGALVPGLLAARLLIDRLYHLDLGWPYYAWGYAFALPSYHYMVMIFALLRLDRSRIVVGVILAGTAFNAALNLALIPTQGLLGALAPSAVTQMLIMAAFIAVVRLGRREGGDVGAPVGAAPPV